jgi:hypothetical protein
MDPNALQDFHSASSRKSRLRRWLVVCMYTGYLLSFVLTFLPIGAWTSHCLLTHRKVH